jgi:hypothetical protein
MAAWLIRFLTGARPGKQPHTPDLNGEDTKRNMLWKIDCWFPLTWEHFLNPVGRFFILFFLFFLYMYAPNNHTCSVIPLWRENNSVLFLYERRKNNKNFYARGRRTVVLPVRPEKKDCWFPLTLPGQFYPAWSINFIGIFSRTKYF